MTYTRRIVGVLGAGTATASGGVAVNISGNTGGTTSLISSGTAVLVGGSNVTLSQNGQSITINAAPGALSYWEPFMIGTGSALSALGNGVMRILPLYLPANVTATQVNNIVHFSISTSSNSSFRANCSLSFGLYTLSAGTLLNLITASSAASTLTISITSSISSDFWNGLRAVSFPVNINMSPGGNYWYAFLSSSSTTNANWATMRQLIPSIGPQSAVSYVGTNAATAGAPPFRGGGYSAVTAALPATIGMSDLNQTNPAFNGNSPVYINFNNIT